MKASITCRDCGDIFEGGPLAQYCEKCKTKRRNKHKFTYKICNRCGEKRKISIGQNICRKCVYELARTEDKPKNPIIAEQRRAARQTGGKLKEIKQCPNFDGGNVVCATCEPGSWEFKDCGRKV